MKQVPPVVNQSFLERERKRIIRAYFPPAQIDPRPSLNTYFVHLFLLPLAPLVPSRRGIFPGRSFPVSCPGFFLAFCHSPFIQRRSSPLISRRHYREMPPKIPGFGAIPSEEAFTDVYIFIYIFSWTHGGAVCARGCTKGKVVEQFPQLLPFPRKRPLSSVDVDVRRFRERLLPPSTPYFPFFFPFIIPSFDAGEFETLCSDVKTR